MGILFSQSFRRGVSYFWSDTMLNRHFPYTINCSSKLSYRSFLYPLPLRAVEAGVAILIYRGRFLFLLFRYCLTANALAANAPVSYGDRSCFKEVKNKI